VKTTCYRFVKALFPFDGSFLVERQLDEYAIAASLDVEISGIKVESFDCFGSCFFFLSHCLERDACIARRVRSIGPHSG
jgi:hypothetical protein